MGLRPLVSNAVNTFVRAAGTSTQSQVEPARMEKSKKAIFTNLGKFICFSHINYFINNCIFLLAINNVTLLGRVGADPQRKGTDEHPVVVFSMATHTNYRYDTGEFLQRTEWHRVVCFKPGLRETILNFLKKGQRVHVTGKITYGEIRGDDGKSRSTTSITAEDIIFFHTTSENK